MDTIPDFKNRYGSLSLPALCLFLIRRGWAFGFSHRERRQLPGNVAVEPWPALDRSLLAECVYFFGGKWMIRLDTEAVRAFDVHHRHHGGQFLHIILVSVSDPFEGSLKMLKELIAEFDPFGGK